MDDAPLMCSIKRIRDLLRDREGLGNRQAAEALVTARRDSRRERVAFDQFQHERADAVRFFQTIDRPDVRVIQRREDLRLPLESSEAFRIAGEQLWKDFDRDVTIQLGVAGAIDLTHPADAEEGSDLVRAEASARLQRHWWLDYIARAQPLAGRRERGIRARDSVMVERK